MHWMRGAVRHLIPNFPFLWGPKKDHTRLSPSLVMILCQWCSTMFRHCIYSAYVQQKSLTLEQPQRIHFLRIKINRPVNSTDHRSMQYSVLKAARHPLKKGRKHPSPRSQRQNLSVNMKLPILFISFLSLAGNIVALPGAPLEARKDPDKEPITVLLFLFIQLSFLA